jgi:polysaccharide export outer membrane protein
MHSRRPGCNKISHAIRKLYRVLLIAQFGLISPPLIEGCQEQSLNAQVEEASGTRLGARPRSDYVLGSEDEIVIRALDAEELSNKPIRIDGSGNINVPMIGRLHTAGLTVRELESQIRKELGRFIVDPDVSVLITAYRSQPVSVLGSVRNPGTHQLEGHKSLIEVLSLAGGLSGEAGNTVKVTRRAEWGEIPLPNAIVDRSGEYCVAEIGLRSLLEARNPQENIKIMPNDVLLVPRGKMIYVVGEVKKSGGFVFPERESVSVLQAIAMAEGVSATASSKHARIIRPVADSKRLEIPIDLRAILAGKSVDVSMQPEDILFIPNSYAKSTFRRTLDTTLSTISSMIVYRGW